MMLSESGGVPASQSRSKGSAPVHHCILLGGGGHARVLLDCLETNPLAQPAGILDPDQSQWGQDVLGCRVLGGDELLPDLIAAGRVDSFVVSLGGVGNNGPRARLFSLATGLGLLPLTVVHPSAVVSALAEIGAGCQLLPGCIVNAGVRLQDGVLINTGAIVEHDCLVAEHAHISTGARLGGSVQIGALSHVGIGATVRQGIRIGRNTLVGAGAVVVADVPDDVVVAGVPARIMKRRIDND
jgi:sugar O-acyltransferase (sialic acid O-acetyltransferase NeuD family)